MPMAWENDNLSDNFGPYKNKKSTIEELDIEEDNIDLVGKSLDIESRVRDILSEHTP